jgi:hypothetical protein
MMRQIVANLILDLHAKTRELEENKVFVQTGRAFLPSMTLHVQAIDAIHRNQI